MIIVFFSNLYDSVNLWKNDEEKSTNCMTVDWREMSQSYAVKKGHKLIQKVMRILKRV